MKKKSVIHFLYSIHYRVITLYACLSSHYLLVLRSFRVLLIPIFVVLKLCALTTPPCGHKCGKLNIKNAKCELTARHF